MQRTIRKLESIQPSQIIPLDERIKKIRAEIDAVIDAHVQTIAKRSPGVPLEVVRRLLTARAPTCRCAQYLDIAREDTA